MRCNVISLSTYNLSHVQTNQTNMLITDSVLHSGCPYRHQREIETNSERERLIVQIRHREEK